MENKEIIFLVSKELERKLIHYSHARKLSRNEKSLPGHHAKPTTHYIKTLEEGNIKNISTIYSELCQYTHPASQSVAYLCKFIDEENFEVKINSDKRNISEIVDNQKNTILDLMMFGFTPTFLVLKVLLHYNIPQYHVNFMKDINLSNIPSWRKCEEFLEKIDIATYPNGRYKI